MRVAESFPRPARLLVIPALLLGLLVAGAWAAGDTGAELNLEALKSLQDERRSFARTMSPSVVAIASERPDMSPPETNMTAPQGKAASGFVVDGEYVVTSIESLPLANPQASSEDDRYLSVGGDVWMMAHDGTEFSGEVVGRDIRNLLLLIKMDDGHPKLPSLALGNSDDVKMGSTAIGLGNTLDSLVIDRQISMSYGTVSGFYRFEPVDVMHPGNPDTGGDPYKGNVLEVDVSVHDGDHGGPIVNLDGEVIGMMCAHYMAGRHLGCAVPSNQIRAVLSQLKKSIPEDELAQGWLGFKYTFNDSTGAIVVAEVEEDGPAEQAGIEEGWQLLRVDNYAIPNRARLAEMLGTAYITRERTVGGMFQRRVVEVPVSYGVPVGTHIQLTLRNPDQEAEITVDLVVGQKAEDF